MDLLFVIDDFDDLVVFIDCVIGGDISGIDEVIVEFEWD